MANDTASQTICILRNGSGFDLNRYVQRTFKSEDVAYKYINTLTRNVAVVVIPGTWRTGMAVPLTIKGRTLA